jgi:hypothetical protein
LCVIREKLVLGGKLVLSQATQINALVITCDSDTIVHYSGSRLIGSLWDRDKLIPILILISGSASTNIMYERVIWALSS